MRDKTVEYYNKNAQSFFETTVHADMSLQMYEFVRLLPEGELCWTPGAAEVVTVSHFWKKGSGSRLLTHLRNCVEWRRNSSGSGEQYRGERHFTDADETYLRGILEGSFEILAMRDSRDVRPGREEELWINVFARKKGDNIS